MFTNGKYESAESLQTKHRFLHWLHVMISKRPGTVESPGGIHRRRHQKRRKAVKLLPKCCPKQKSPAFRGVFSEKRGFYLRYFVILLKGLKSRKDFFITRARQVQILTKQICLVNLFSDVHFSMKFPW